MDHNQRLAPHFWASDNDQDPISESGLVLVGYDEDGLPELLGTPEQHAHYHQLTQNV